MQLEQIDFPISPAPIGAIAAVRKLEFANAIKFRLLVVRLGAMGDILHALPAVTALRLAHPGWEIDWVVEPRWRALLAAPESTGRGPQQPSSIGSSLRPQRIGAKGAEFQETHEIKALRDQLKAVTYSAVIDLQGGLRSASGPYGRLPPVLSAKPTHARLRRLLFTERVQTHGVHVIEQDVELASAVAGDPLIAVPPILPFDPAAEAWCDTFLASRVRGPCTHQSRCGWGAKQCPSTLRSRALA